MKKVLLSFFIASISFVSINCTKSPVAPIPTLLDTITVAGGNGLGAAANQLHYPTGLTVDDSGNVYVADEYNQRIQKFPPGSDSTTNGITIAGGNGFGDLLDQVDYPQGITLDGKGNIYIVDQHHFRIQKLQLGNQYSVTVAGSGTLGSAPNEFGLSLTGIYVDKNGYLYVADQGNHRIQKFPPGSDTLSMGVTVAGITGSNGSAADQLDDPVNVFVDASGNIYVADAGNYRVQKFPPNSTSGTNGVTVAGGNGKGIAANQFESMAGIVVDANNNIYVSDFGNNRVQKWTPGAITGITVAGDPNGISGSNYNQLHNPTDIFLDAGAKNLYISDFQNNRIQKWGLK
jgi:sugar lactone lactonase YvrE